MSLKINEFYDINKLPQEAGLTVVAISMPFITTIQSPQACLESSRHLISKIKKSSVGAIISYSDGLYMYSEEPAWVLKQKYQRLLEQHKRGYLNLIHKDVNVIPSAFTFTTWNQMILDCSEFDSNLVRLKEHHAKDENMRALVAQDIETSGREVTAITIAYLLEEILLDFLVAHMKVRLRNDYVNDHEKWVLNCYHGKPHRSHVYLHQSQLLDIRTQNVYRNSWYDLKNRKLYDFERLDIESFDFSR
jgi:hypothetical protein